MYTQKTIIFLTFFLLFTISVVPVSAESNSSSSGEAKRLLKDLKNDFNKERKELQNEFNADKDALKNLRASGSAEKKNFAVIVNGQVTAINSTTLTVTKDGKTYTVTTNSETKFRRNFGGQSSLSEFAVGNMVDVRGQWTDAAKTTIAARMIHNRSIMKRFGAFVGEITSKNGNTFVLKTVNRGEQTVTVNSSTKYVNRKMETITLNDVAITHRVRVKGMWDKSNNTITEVTQVKDYSLPPKSTPSPSVSE